MKKCEENESEENEKMYKCGKCGKEFENVEFIRCPYCGNKVLFKRTPPLARKVSTD